MILTSVVANPYYKSGTAWTTFLVKFLLNPFTCPYRFVLCDSAVGSVKLLARFQGLLLYLEHLEVRMNTSGVYLLRRQESSLVNEICYLISLHTFFLHKNSLHIYFLHNL